jgi:O-acetyl-ADP-ribose deacetylase (regulator of RNase III)
VWGGGGRGEEQLLVGACRAALWLASENDCRSVALPALSTGAYRYPIPDAARAAVDTAVAFLKELRGDQSPELVRFVLFSADVLAIFEEALEELEH